MSDIDPDLLAAFVPEFRQATMRLCDAAEGHAATRLVANMRAMADAIGIAALVAPLDAAAAAADPFDAPALRRAAATLATTLDEALRPKLPEMPIRTLIVDDSATMRRLLRESLATDPAFAIVGEAADGAEALALCTALAPDLIMLDIEMPHMDGLATLRRWTLEGCGAVVVVSSATPPGSALAQDVRRLGAATVVAKPSGALSADMVARRGAALRFAARRAVGRDATP